MDESLRLPPSLEARLAHIPSGALDFEPVPVKRTDAAGFAAAWDRALHFAGLRPPPPGTTAWQRGVEGILVPVQHRGRIIGWRRKYCGRSLAALLNTYYRLQEAEA